MGKTYRVGESIVGEVLSGEAVVLNLATGQYFALNGTATRFWQLLGELGDVERVRDAMVLEFEVDRASLEHDMTSLLEVLVARGLVTPVE